jgi:hypothetical protein
MASPQADSTSLLCGDRGGESRKINVLPEKNRYHAEMSRVVVLGFLQPKRQNYVNAIGPWGALHEATRSAGGSSLVLRSFKANGLKPIG